VPIAERGQVVIPAGWTLVVASSGVHADKTRSAKEAYNRLAREAAALLRLWNGSGPAAPSLHAALHSHPDAADRLRTLVAERDEQHRLATLLHLEVERHLPPEPLQRAVVHEAQREIEQERRDQQQRPRAVGQHVLARGTARISGKRTSGAAGN
jgi:hypothetical protein